MAVPRPPHPQPPAPTQASPLHDMRQFNLHQLLACCRCSLECALAQEDLTADGGACPAHTPELGASPVTSVWCSPRGTICIAARVWPGLDGRAGAVSARSSPGDGSSMESDQPSSGSSPRVLRMRVFCECTDIWIALSHPMRGR